MKTLITCLAAGLLAAVILIPGGADAAGTATDFAWEGTVASGQTVEIKGVNGSIVARAGSGNRVEVTATKKGKRQDPSSVKIEVVEHAGGVTVCAVYPGAGNECKPGKGGNLSAKNNDVTVSFEVSVPAGASFVGRTVNGSVKGAGLTGPATGITVNGSVELETEAHARAETVNGSITAKMGGTSFSEGLEFETVNGSITLELDPGINVEVRASTVNGKVKTDLPLEVPHSWHGGKARGTLGSGGASLEASTVNGSITLRKTDKAG